MPRLSASFLKQKLHNTWLHPRYISTIYLRAALAEARPLVHGVLLDVGCGMSPYRDLFEGRTDGYIRVDWPKRLIENRPDLLGDAQRLPFLDGSFDTILATELIEHLPRPRQFLAEAHRLLRAGGALIVSAPFLEPLHEEPRDFRRFTSYGLRALVEEHSFTVDGTWQRGGWWSVVVGSFVSQTLFDWFNPDSGMGRRDVVSALVAPFFAVLQWIAWALDGIMPSERYALGYVVAASVGSRPHDANSQTPP